MAKNLTLTAKIKLDVASLAEVERRLGTLNSKVSSSIDQKISSLKKSGSFSMPGKGKVSSVDKGTKESKDESQASYKKMLSSVDSLSVNLKKYSSALEKIAPKLAKYDNSEKKLSEEKSKKESKKSVYSKKEGSSRGRNRDIFHGINSISQGSLPIAALSGAGIAGIAAYAAYKVVELGYKATKTDFGLYSQSADTGLSANALKYMRQGLAPGVGDQLFATFSQSQRFADFNRFGETNQILSLVRASVGFKNAGYLQDIMRKKESGIDFQKDVINQTLQKYQQGAFGKEGSPLAKNQANAILQSVFGGDFSSVIESYKKGGKTQQLLENINNDAFVDKKANLVTQDNALKSVELAANIQLNSSNIFHEAVNRFIDVWVNHKQSNYDPSTGKIYSQGNI